MFKISAMSSKCSFDLVFGSIYTFVIISGLVNRKIKCDEFIICNRKIRCDEFYYL